ncbi:MAG TPA: hypothetical protein VMH77_07170 [Steroidobacteraceae bacterium]|nr:hypothetical protein [Steroidobacteraceae bacterium]
MNGAARAAGDLLARGVVATTLQLVRALQGGRPAVAQGLVRERRRLLAELARNMNNPAQAGLLAALEAAVAESDRTVGALIG